MIGRKVAQVGPALQQRRQGVVYRRYVGPAPASVYVTNNDNECHAHTSPPMFDGQLARLHKNGLSDFPPVPPYLMGWGQSGAGPGYQFLPHPLF